MSTSPRSFLAATLPALAFSVSAVSDEVELSIEVELLAQ